MDPREVATIRGMAIIDGSPAAPTVSIVIPTYNHLDDYLRPCLESIQQYTDLSSCEVVVVANGCTDGTVEFLRSLPPPFRHVVHPEPLGFTRAANAGVRAAYGDNILLLNNDTVVLPQPKNRWIDLLLAPMLVDPKVGITGPVKFSWDCAGTARRAVAFWCAMIRRRLFAEIGLLDEIFSPGTGEDGDFSIKAERAGYRLVQVPVDASEEFGKGIPDQSFPIYHRGSGTFSERDYSDVIRRNTAILEKRWGATRDRLDEIYRTCLDHECDTNKLFPTLRSYAQGRRHVTEFGVRGVFTTWAFLAARPGRLVSYDIERSPNIEEAVSEAGKAGVPFEFLQQDVLAALIEPTDTLFIDTRHTYAQLRAELARHADWVSRHILVHDTESYGEKGEDGGPGEMRAIDEFLAARPEWSLKERIRESNGLVVLERRASAITVVIPTAHHFRDALEPCLEAVLRYTNLADKEIIVVANGSPPEAINWLRGKPVRVLEFPSPLGYIRAVNAGIRAALGEYVVTLDDDSFLQPQDPDEWIRTLMMPLLEDAGAAASGPFSASYPDLGQVLHSGCAMYRRSALEAVGLFDEAFNPGYMGDEDLSLRLRKEGFRISEAPRGQRKEYVNGTFQIQFPIVHTGTVNTMPKHTTDLPLVERNRRLLYERHAPAPVGAPVVPVPRAPVPALPASPRFSIIIPTYNHLEDLLKPCLESIVRHTDLSGGEIIVVANGCTDGTEEHVRSLGHPFRVLSFPDALGFTRATNEGLKVARGDYLILFNNDNMLLPQPRGQWLDFLVGPFEADPKTGITGPLQLHDDYAGEDVIIGFCLCVSRRVLREAMAETEGLLDETFSPGGGEDIDLCCRVRRKGYTVRQVPREGKLGFSHTNTGEFMIGRAHV